MRAKGEEVSDIEWLITFKIRSVYGFWLGVLVWHV